MRNAWALWILLVVAAACDRRSTPGGAAPAPYGGVDMATAERIERLVVLPKEAAALSDYARFYYRAEGAPPGVVTGYYLGARGVRSKDWPSPGIYLRRSDFVVNDGGCAVVQVTFDTTTDRVLSIACNGQS